MVKIPFAYSLTLDRVVEISTVPPGRRCDCLCPSCGQAMVAKKGSVNQWHFSHDSIPSSRPTEECEISFLVSCRQFITDAAIAGDIPDIVTPPVEYFGKSYRHSRALTGVQWQEGVSNFDISTTIGAFQLHVYLSYPGRESPVLPENRHKAAFLEIDIQPIQKAIEHQSRDGRNVIGQARDLFTSGGSLFFFGLERYLAGRWIYHPFECHPDVVAERNRRKEQAADLRLMPAGPGKDFRREHPMTTKTPAPTGEVSEEAVEPGRALKRETRYPKGYKGLTEAEKKLAHEHAHEFGLLVEKYQESGLDEQKACVKAAVELMVKERTARY
ncbi:competence protein CoiA family protein [Alloalcanivorax venustensis]|uniref:competence protein CoiA family protein n=1 Tax=Alloalcanivorax venustensis TaxID=172371 RepID=UPI003F7BD9BC